MSTIKEIQDEIIDDFEMFEDWSEKYEYIIELGFELPELDSKYKTDEYKIFGCQSNVWVRGYKKDNKIIYEGDSEAMVVKGLASIMLRLFSNQTSEAILKADIPAFFKELGLDKHLSSARSSGLKSMIQKMKQYATEAIVE